MTVNFRCVFFILLFALALTSGCGNRDAGDSETKATSSQAASSTEQTSLQEQVDAALDYTFYSRQLNTAEHGAWQVLHGVLAYQERFPVRVGHSQNTQSAISYLLNGGTVQGWEFRVGQRLENGRVGLRAVMQPGTKRGQGHSDQWLAILAQCDFPLDKEIIADDRKYTIGDLVDQVKLDVSDNIEREYSWTLIGLSWYLKPTDTWTANDGEEWSIPKLIEIELEQDLNQSACGGTHRLIGVSMALNKYRKTGAEPTGIWAEAETRIRTSIRTAQQTQNQDGSFSPNYFARPGQTVDMATRLATTGHILEFLALSMSKEELQAEWVQNAASNLSGLFMDTEGISLECGALYHAAHGLALYRDIVFGEKTYDR
ncbi:MAG: hypothetical protein KDB27_36340 [Planctomycetales bacterium]|nr:hypothetical protein [Planctomycetales bacterium]